MNRLGIVQRLAQRGAHQVFIAQVRRESRAPRRPVKISVDAHAIDIRAVIVEGISFGLVSIEFPSVLIVVPVNRRAQSQTAHFGFRHQGHVGFQRMFELVIGGKAVEIVGTEILHADARMPTGSDPSVLISPLVKGLGGLEVSIQLARGVSQVAIASGVRSRKGVVPSS